jgi:hypothetical protein
MTQKEDKGTESQVPPDFGKALMSALDAWASFFISRAGKSFILKGMLSRLVENTVALEQFCGHDVRYQEMKSHLMDLQGRYGDFEILNDDPFNLSMCRFLTSYEMEFSNSGLNILRNVRTLLGFE